MQPSKPVSGRRRLGYIARFSAIGKTDMQETGSLKIVYSVSERDRARLTRRMCAYIPKRDRRRRLAVSLLALALLLVLYYGFFHNWQAALDYLGSVGEYVCEALCDESGQIAEDWDGLISGAAAARSHVVGLMYWMAALVLFVLVRPDRSGRYASKRVN